MTQWHVEGTGQAMWNSGVMSEEGPGVPYGRP
jgi:hypothetical protein